MGEIVENCTLSAKFRNWLLHQLEIKGWSQRELSRRAKYSPSAISKVISDHVKPTFEFCEAMAKGLGVDVKEVLEHADLLNIPPSRNSTRIETIKQLLEQLPDDRLIVIEDFATYVRDKYIAGKSAKKEALGNDAALKKVESRINIFKAAEEMSQEEIANLLLYLSERLRLGAGQQNRDAQTPAILASQ